MFGYVQQSLRSLRFRSSAMQLIKLGSILSTILIIWQLLILLTASKHPVVVVLTGSMEPGIRKGDVLFLNTMENRPIHAGEIIVFNIEKLDIPIVHRVVKVLMQNDKNEVKVLTKGDNNAQDDSYGIYSDGQLWLESRDVVGRVIGYLPYIGWPTILLSEKPFFKYLLLGALSLLVINSN